MNHLLRSLGLFLLLGSATASAQVPDNSLPIRLGVDQGGKSLFRGEIAAVRLYNRALSDAEIKNLAQAERSRESTLAGIIGQWLAPKLPLVGDEQQKGGQGGRRKGGHLGSRIGPIAGPSIPGRCLHGQFAAVTFSTSWGRHLPSWLSGWLAADNCLPQFLPRGHDVSSDRSTPLPGVRRRRRSAATRQTASWW
jgi:hypothetical protein